MDDSLIDLKYIHWSYLHCCQTVSNKRKPKKFHWNTFWVELSGTVLRLYKDCSLPPDSALENVPRIRISPVKEDLLTVAFLDLRSGSVNILPNKKKSAIGAIFRQHLFQLRLTGLGNHYVFQAHSLSSMLLWVSKIQESIDACAENISFLADEKMKLVKFMMANQNANQNANIKLAVEAPNESPTDLISEEKSQVPKKSNEKLTGLKKLLMEKKGLAVQFDQQMIDFLGNKGVFCRQEFICQIKQDYYLVSGREDTLIPAHTTVRIFGQLRNRRWRCFVERNDILKSLKRLLRNSQIKDENDINCIMKKINSIPDYPLIGSLPNSVINFIKDEAPSNDSNNELTVCNVTDGFSNETVNSVLDPMIDNSTSNNNQYTELRNAFDEVDSLSVTSDYGSITENTQSNDGNNELPMIYNLDELSSDSLSVTSDYDSILENKSSVLNDVIVPDIYSDQDSNNGEMFLKSKEILIQKKLKLTGITIVVGSSSSDDDDDDNVDFRKEPRRFRPTSITNAVFEDMRSANNCNEEVERNEKSYIRERPKDLKNLKHSYSCDQISYKGEFTIKADILKRFSKKLIKHEKNGTKNLIEETGIGPEVKPPRNERRTLKLSKKDDKFGFLIEKYSFRVGDGNHEDRIFVSFVEDESSAYIGGLREGDVILKVNNENLEDLDFPEVKEVLKSTRDQLNLVVKFMDAINHKKLTERLKEKEATLAARRKSIERLDKEIEELKSGTSNGCSSVAEDLNEYTYDISDSGSVSSESSDDTHKNSSEKELYPLDDSQTECCEISILNETSADLELLDYYSEKKRTGSSIRRTESMPVQKNNSNLKNTLNSAKKKEEKYNISNEQTCVNTNFASEENETTNENYVPNSIHKAYRTKSYKRAVKRKEVV